MGEISIKKPGDCTKTELESFSALVLDGGEVTAKGLNARIKAAEALVFLTHDTSLEGIAAVKKPEERYKNSVFQKAQATIQANEFTFEFGWVFVRPASRGNGLSHKLIEAALAASCGQGVFATSRSDNTPMHKLLKTHNFSCHGKAYESSRGKHELVLFIRSATQ